MAGIVSRAMCLSASERRLLVRAATRLWRARIGLWMSPFTEVYRDRMKQAELYADILTDSRHSPEDIARAVNRAGRLVPQATCLVKALAGHELLRAAGYDSGIRIGVQRSKEEKFGAHAWVESDGHIVIGGQQSVEFVAFPSLVSLSTRTAS